MPLNGWREGPNLVEDPCDSPRLKFLTSGRSIDPEGFLLFNFVFMARGGSMPSNASLLERLSCNIFITNFPAKLSAKDLWNTCAQNLRSVWMGSFHLFANVARFNRDTKATSSQKASSFNPSNVPKPSFAKVVKGSGVNENYDAPVLVLERGLLNYEGDPVLVGCVKDFKTLPNIHIVCSSEGFSGLKISYLGGFWVLLEFDSFQSCEKFHTHEGIKSWFSTLSQWTSNFEIQDKVVWIDIEGTSLRVWSQSTFNKIASKWGELVILEGKVSIVRAKEVTGWVPEFGDGTSSHSDDGSDNNSVGKHDWVEEEDDNEVVQDSFQSHVNVTTREDYSNVKPSNEARPLDNLPEQVITPSGDPFGIEDLILKTSKIHKKDAPMTGNSEPEFPPGFTPVNSNHKVNETVPAQVIHDHSSVQRSKEASNNVVDDDITDFELNNKSYCGSNLDHTDSMAHCSKPVNGFSILERLGGKEKKPWVKKLCHSNQVNFLSIRETKMVAFDVFIVKAFWGNASFDFATSSARGRSGGILCGWDNMLFQKKRVYSNEHCLCVEEDDFTSVIEDSWNNDGIIAPNPMFLLKNKLKSLKQRLKTWSSEKKGIKDHDRKRLQDSLIAIDLRLDQDVCLPDDLLNRANIVRDLQAINKKDSVDLAQKAKVKWAIEGDENTKFFHGIVNKKRRHLAIKGILIDGEWIDNPTRVKLKFYNHFANRFSAPNWTRVPFDDQFLSRLNIDHSCDLERDVTIERFKTLGKNRNSFFLGADLDERKITWVSWRKVMAQKQHGGLGVNSLYALNLALIFKWIWHFKSAHSGLWLNVIKAIYGNEGSLNHFSLYHHGCSVWSGILKVIDKLKTKGVDLHNFCKLVVGNGNTIKFWHDKWYGDVCFKDKFHRYFNLELQKDISVALKLQRNDFALSFRRRPRSGIEESQFCELSSLLASRSDRQAIVLHYSLQPTGWSKVLPIKLNIFMWRMLLDKLPTRSNLSIRGLDIPCSLCPNCGTGVETRDHFFFVCPMALDLFRLLGRWWDIQIPILLDLSTWES
ncbi:RNA-directed DNA polymerase, eukaryota, reverse transcriptase zinc-binding domain protein [Tanacetum coccineum]